MTGGTQLQHPSRQLELALPVLDVARHAEHMTDDSVTLSWRPASAASEVKEAESCSSVQNANKLKSQNLCSHVLKKQVEAILLCFSSASVCSNGYTKCQYSVSWQLGFTK
jgi:hypothetical protein